MENKLVKKFFEDGFLNTRFFDFFDFLEESNTSLLKTWDKFEDDKTGEKVVQIGIPGFNKDELEISTEEDTIFIKGEIKNENTKKFYKNSISYSISDSNVDIGSINASLDNGILEIRYKILPGKEPQKIEIK
jgi:HSP20 family protein